MAVFGTLMSEQKRISSGLCGFGAITGVVHQVVGWLPGTASIIPSSLSCCSSFATFCFRFRRQNIRQGVQFLIVQTQITGCMRGVLQSCS